MYSFHTKFSKIEIIDYVAKNSCEKSIFQIANKICASIKGEKITLIERTEFIRHPLQREFNIKLISNEETITVEGHFVYPLGPTIVAFMFGMLFVYSNIQAVSHTDIITTIIATSIFLLFYATIFLQFVVGKMLYKTQEKNVVAFFKKIEKKFKTIS